MYKAPYYPVGWLYIRLQSVRSHLHVLYICPLADGQRADFLQFSLFTALGTVYDACTIRSGWRSMDSREFEKDRESGSHEGTADCGRILLSSNPFLSRLEDPGTL